MAPDDAQSSLEQLLAACLASLHEIAPLPRPLVHACRASLVATLDAHAIARWRVPFTRSSRSYSIFLEG